MKTLSTTTALRILLIIAAILSFTKASAYDFEIGKLQYSITSDSTVEVTGVNFNINSNSNNSFEIPNHVTFNNVEYTVTAIGDRAFYNHYIKDLIIPETITSIGVDAFKKEDYDFCRITSIIMKALTPPMMHDSFDQHDKPAFSIFNSIYPDQDLLVLFVYKEAYPLYKDLNEEYHFFRIISFIDGDEPEARHFETVYQYCPCTGSS